MKTKDISKNSELFWKTSKEYISHVLPDLRKVSNHTISAYRDSLNIYINYLEIEKSIKREHISFSDFGRTNLINYLDWMLNSQKYAKKTCNLRITAIHSLLEYAAEEYSMDLMAIYLEACTVKCINAESKPIIYFETYQMKALLAAPPVTTKTGRRNQMILILYYDTAARISELLDLTLEGVHLDSKVPYITILGKGRKYRNIPLMNRTISHLNRYLKEFHEDNMLETPLFYAKTYGLKHQISRDTVENMIKKYVSVCISNGIDMPKEAHCHMIRKSRAMDLYQSGVPLPHIQQLLGHENMSTTTGFYAFATLDTLSKALEEANKTTKMETEKKWNDKDILKKLYSL